jgi:hypothetical protein
MRFTLASSVLLCFLATRFSLNNAGVVPVSFECHGSDCVKHDSIGWSVVSDLLRRGGGGGGGGGKGGGHGDGGGSTGGGGTGGTSGGGNGSPQTDGGQTGETGGFAGQEGEGGFSETCTKKRSWSLFWNRSPASGTTGGGSSQNNNAPVQNNNAPVQNNNGPVQINNAPGNNPVNGPANNHPPGARNNYNAPATTNVQTYRPGNPIDLATKVTEFKSRIESQKLDGGHWFFFSGFQDRRTALPTVRSTS